MSEPNLIVDVHHLYKSFQGRPAVIDVSLQVQRGEICGFLGPNGSGKTTVIRMLCGLLTPDAGTGTCLGYDIITQTHEIKQHIGYIPQFFGLYKQLSIYENLMFMAEIYGVTNREKRVHNVMEQLDLTSRQKQLSGTLSGGWKQRLSLAAALIHDPFLLILDEPTASIDPKSRRDFWELMHSLAAEGMTVFLSCHNMDEAERCHQIAYISYGHLLLVGKIKEIIRKVNLSTWRVSGPNLPLLAKQLQTAEEYGQVITFFDALHVTGQDQLALQELIAPYRHNPNFHWERSEPTLEDVFVWLSNQATANQKDSKIR